MAHLATWVWDRPRAEDLLSWVRASGVGQIFVGVGRDLGTSGDLAWMRSVVQLMHGHGVLVAALGGDKTWVDDPAPALAWQQTVLETGLFDGIHLDVEVWAREDWDDRRVELGAAYLVLLRRLAAVCPLPLEADIAFHLHEVPTESGDSLETAVMRVVDAVTVLSYRNTVTGPDSITGVSASALAAAGRLSVPCRLAVETRYLGSDPVSRKQTFHGVGRSALQRAMTEVDTLLSPVSSYVGIAVHDYAHWRVL